MTMTRPRSHSHQLGWLSGGYLQESHDEGEEEEEEDEDEEEEEEEEVLG